MHDYYLFSKKHGYRTHIYQYEEYGFETKEQLHRHVCEEYGFENEPIEDFIFFRVDGSWDIGWYVRIESYNNPNQFRWAKVRLFGDPLYHTVEQA